VITNFWSRVVENPSDTKKFSYVYYSMDLVDAEEAADVLLKWQKFFYDDPKSTLFGGNAKCMSTATSVNCLFSGAFCKYPRLHFLQCTFPILISFSSSLSNSGLH